MSAAIVNADRPDPTLRNVLAATSLRWIFVGGKGGVGKTTTSCSLAAQLASVRRNVLLISTDPAHNLSDAFRQKFTRAPTKVNGFDNLFAMEVDPTPDAETMEALAGGPGGDALGGAGGFLGDLATSIPGIDEAMSFAEVMKQVQSLDYDAIVFDTAPTGHTLRLLSFPSTLQKGLDKLSGFKNMVSGALAQVGPLMGAPPDAADALAAKLDELKAVVDEVATQFKDAALTTFVCVCIPEFLSLYETERLVQELAKYGIDCRNIVINQIIPAREAAGSRLLAARARMQQTYLDQFDDLYDDFHIVRVPLLDEEVRGGDAIKSFSAMLVSPDPSVAAGSGEGGGDAPDAGLQAEMERLRARVAELEAALAAK
jgi:arsenite/tail-anchored protein-transporting ATPase